MIPCDNSFFAALLRQVGERVWHEPATYRIEIHQYEETGSIQIQTQEPVKYKYLMKVTLQRKYKNQKKAKQEKVQRKRKIQILLSENIFSGFVVTKLS